MTLIDQVTYRKVSKKGARGPVPPVPPSVSAYTTIACFLFCTDNQLHEDGNLKVMADFFYNCLTKGGLSCLRKTSFTFNFLFSSGEE